MHAQWNALMLVFVVDKIVKGETMLISMQSNQVRVVLITENNISTRSRPVRGDSQGQEIRLTNFIQL